MRAPIFVEVFPDGSLIGEHDTVQYDELIVAEDSRHDGLWRDGSRRGHASRRSSGTPCGQSGGNTIRHGEVCPSPVSWRAAIALRAEGVAPTGTAAEARGTSGCPGCCSTLLRPLATLGRPRRGLCRRLGEPRARRRLRRGRIRFPRPQPTATRLEEATARSSTMPVVDPRPGVRVTLSRLRFVRSDCARGRRGLARCLARSDAGVERIVRPSRCGAHPKAGGAARPRRSRQARRGRLGGASGRSIRSRQGLRSVGRCVQTPSRGAR